MTILKMTASPNVTKRGFQPNVTQASYATQLRKQDACV